MTHTSLILDGGGTDCWLFDTIDLRGEEKEWSEVRGH